jgi:hypothetical protein
MATLAGASWVIVILNERHPQGLAFPCRLARGADANTPVPIRVFLNAGSS